MHDATYIEKKEGKRAIQAVRDFVRHQKGKEKKKSKEGNYSHAAEIFQEKGQGKGRKGDPELAMPATNHAALTRREKGVGNLNDSSPASQARGERGRGGKKGRQPEKFLRSCEKGKQIPADGGEKGGTSP